MENMKVAQAATMKLLYSGGENYETPPLDEQWTEEEYFDDWVDGWGPRFGNDASSSAKSNFESVGYEDDDDGYGVPMETPAANETGSRRNLNDYELDVVFVGDSITEQRQGTSKRKSNDEYTGIKEVFDKTFTKDKGGEFNGIAMGISGDTVCATPTCLNLLSEFRLNLF